MPSVLSCCRYRVAIWVCLAIAEQHKPGPCNSRSNRQCNLLIHPSLVFVLKCLSFYPLRLDNTATHDFSLSLELFHMCSPLPLHSGMLPRLCSYSLAVPVSIYRLPSTRVTRVRWACACVLCVVCVGTFSCSFLQKSSVSRELKSLFSPLFL